MRAPLLLALLPGGCLATPPEPPTPVILDRAASPALDGRDTFALAGQAQTRFVSLLQTARGATAVRADGALVDLGRPGAVVAEDVLPELRASEDGRVVAFAIRSADAVADVHVLTEGHVRRLTEGLPAVVLAVSPDGHDVAFLAAVGGLPAVWTVPADGGAPRQRTNVGVVRDPTRRGPPKGFVPPPERAADVVWRDGALAYATREGTVRIAIDEAAP